MKLLWLCNSVPAAVQSHIYGKPVGSVNWVDHVLSGLRQQGCEVRVLCRGREAMGIVDETCSYRCFGEDPAHIYQSDLEKLFRVELRTFKPDVIHSWGTEYAHTHAMVNAAEMEGMLQKMAVSIQGLCYVCARHYTEGIPYSAQRSSTFRDFVRRDNILQQQKKFALRGEHEIAVLKKIQHVIGRTDWDRACVSQINPNAAYHFCNETLRETFYQGGWAYENCKKHRIFASSCAYPIKGFHRLLEAFAIVLEKYPDATLAVPGRDFRKVDTLKKRLRENGYDRYLRSLVRRYRLEDKVEILGGLSAEQMKQQYLQANVFVLPSSIENSPNSLGEAMLLGVPCVASDVGGVSTMMRHGQEGFIYQATAPYMLAYYMDRVFSMEEQVQTLAQAAAAHACITHDPQKNLTDLLGIYEILAK